MKKKYECPHIIIHGNVIQMTAASADSDRQDRIFNAAGHQSDVGTGYLDQCFFVPDTYRCVIND